jgi:hypothetical protein
MLDLLFTLDLAERHMDNMFDTRQRPRAAAEPQRPQAVRDDVRPAARPRLQRLTRAAFAGGRAGS